MEINPVLFFLLLLVNGVALAILVYIAMLRPKMKAREDKLAEAQDESIRQAQDESEHIIRSSVEKAQETLLDAQYLKDDLIRDVEAAMRGIAESAIVSFQEESKQMHGRFAELYTDVKKRYEDETIKTVASLEEIAKGELADFRALMKKVTVEAQRRSEQQAQETLFLVKEEIASYKQEKMKEVEAQVKEMITSVFSHVLGRTLTREEHERLVLEALEDLRRRGLSLNLPKDRGVIAAEFKPVNKVGDGKTRGSQESKTNEKL